MFAKVLRRALILLAVYSIFIIGIFVLQFKNDSIISEKFGSLHITLLESTAEDNSVSLKNKFTISFSGITFSANGDKPVKIKTNNSEKSIALLSWEKISSLSFVLKFTQNINVKFSLSDDSAKAFLNVQATLPSSISSISFPYTLSAGSTVSSLGDSKIQIMNKKISWELNAYEIGDNFVILSRKEPVASYAYIDKTKSFSFAIAESIDNAKETNYINIIENFKNNIIQNFEQISPDSTSVMEQEAVSYVAVMAEKNKYNEALDKVPQNFKKGSSRTYLSAPYFNNLLVTSESLNRQIQSYSDMIKLASETGSYDVFNVKNIADYMCMHPSSETMRKLLRNTASSEMKNINVVQAAGILGVYVDLYDKNLELANLLQGALKACIDKIENCCNLDDNRITIAENGTLLSVINAVQVGDSVLRYGKIAKNPMYEAGGYLILNSYLKESSSFDLRTLSEIYPIVIHNNKYYPHFDIMSFENGRAIWAWTCANNINYENDNSGAITLSVDFPLSYTHYIIINGIPLFKSIYIYDMAFRTDPRFETYNSSGYVYQADKQTLLLKSRHRSEIETIRLIYTDNAVEKSAEIHETEVNE